MTLPAKYPIRFKLLLLIMLCVLTATGTYLGLATQIFKDDKTQLVYEMNANVVKTLAGEMETVLQKYADKIRLLTQGYQSAEWTTTLFDGDSDLIAYGLYRQASGGNSWERIATIRNKDYLKLYGMTAAQIDKLRETRPIPFAKALAKGSVVTNSTIPGGAPLFTFSVSLNIHGENHVAVVDLKADRFLKLLKNRGAISAYIVDDEGKIIVHADPQEMSSYAQLRDLDIVREAVNSPLGFQMKRFEAEGMKWLGTYQAVKGSNLIVISQVSEGHAFEAARRLIEKSLIFGLIVITLSLMLSGWTASGIVRPLKNLLVATEKMSQGDFTGRIHVNTRDEIAALATSFNTMASDLERQNSELGSTHKELELKVKERTTALESQKRQASEAQDALLRTTRLAALGELAGATAHEVLNPLNNMSIRIEKWRKRLNQQDKNNLEVFSQIVQGWKKAYGDGGWDHLKIELMKQVEGKKNLLEEDLENLQGIAREDQKRHDSDEEDVEFLSKEMVRITRMVNNMRSLSRVGGERKPIDIHVPIDDTLVTLSDIFEKRNVTMTKEFGADSREHFSVVGDRDELVQIFSNVIRNAMQAIDSAHRRNGELKVSTKLVKDRIEVRITDNGVGIPSQNLSRIFEPSFTTKSVEEGTGLGLSISRRLVRAFGGEIEVEKSSEGVGTTFLIWFPTEAAAAEWHNEA